jgi:hypothetical protein
MPPRRRPAWDQRLASRLQFERGAYAAYPGLRASSTGHRRYARIVYRVVVPVEHYESRTIEMHFRRNTALPSLTAVYADGPEESPHRYPPADDDHDPKHRRSLCIWHPKAPPEGRWVPSDGLLTLIELTRVHLFKEAYYRETGEWLGKEHPHRRSGSETC